MLENTFIHAPGIGPKKERGLWNRGVRCWADVTENGNPVPFSNGRELLLECIDESMGRLKNEDARWFAEKLPANEAWRLFGAFREKTAYLDIETTGTGAGLDHITTIALYADGETRYYVHGRNMDDFIGDIGAYRILVTYNGRSFDIPFIEHEFGVKLPHAQIDLRYVLRNLGYKGGLKGCEKQLGIDRGELEGVDGYFAVLLWREFKRTGNKKALETLLAYNIEDTVNLEKLMLIAYNKKIRQTPFPELTIAEDVPAPEPLFYPDPWLIRDIQGRRETEREFYL